LLWPDRIARLERHIDLVFRQDVMPKPPEPKPVALPLPPPEPAIERPKLVVAKNTPPPKKQVDIPELPKIPLTAQLPKVSSPPADMPKVIHTGSFGSSATPTQKLAPANVQTGGFGDPNGLPGTGKQGARLSASALGSFDLPQGPGKGNGTGGAKGVQGAVASSGFGSGITQPGPGSGQKQAVQAAGFAAPVSTNANKSGSTSLPPPTVPVEILYKPKAAYTDEARKLKLEGEVLLEVLFRANGQLQVNRVLRGLGHGLDEAAADAASRIRFKPAQRNGSPVDSTVVVHVLFQLAS
jgi:TonB family protein